MIVVVSDVLQNGWTALMHACYDGHIDIASKLLVAGANKSLQNNVTKCFDSSYVLTPLRMH